jgi:conjugal transfer/entry exclusion protein
MADITQEQMMRDRLGNIDQIRDLLFGQQLSTYEKRFETHNQRLNTLETQLASFQEETRTRLNQLQNAFSADLKAAVDALEKKLKYLSLTTQEETNKLQQELQNTDQELSSEIESLTKEFTNTTTAIKDELSDSREKLSKDIQTLKTQVFEELEKCFSNLTDSKVSRVDLAEVLFELCLKVKGTEFIPDIKGSSPNQVQAEFLLPEQRY